MVAGITTETSIAHRPEGNHRHAKWLVNMSNFFFLVLLLLLASCQGTEPDEGSDEPLQSTDYSGRMSKIFLLSHNEGGWSGPAMSATGAFVVRADCLIFKTAEGEFTPLLPAGSKIERTSGQSLQIELRYDEARDAIPLGQSFELAGDVITPSAVAELSKQTVPARCPMKIFRTAGVRQ